LIIAALMVAAAPVSGAFDQFMGSCWAADFTGTMRDVHCFDVLYEGAHIRDRHEVNEGGKVVYAGETTYSLDGDTIVFTYLNGLGGVGTGTVTRDRTKLSFKGAMRSAPDKPSVRIDSEWTILDANHYDVRSLVPSVSTAGNAVLHFSRVN
jgi:hypothetical protein